VTTKHISTTLGDTIVCDICGRTLLRGEHSTTFLGGGGRRSVCELCNSRALHEGWVREGSLSEYDGGAAGAERRRSLLGRLRPRRDSNGAPAPRPAPAPADSGWATSELATTPTPARRQEPRHVRAVPAGTEQKSSSAVDAFNASEHRRTIAGVARSLGNPTVNVSPDDQRTSLVSIVVSWELCWYRYEVDLSDGASGVRVAGQGYELADLSDLERIPNAVADDLGRLSLQH
jgi:hypothetical protein